MPYTGKHMGMTINYSLDERKSIITSTEKACEYFQNSQAIFDNWLLSIASYNCGAGNVQKAIRRAGGNKTSFWEIMPYLPKETRYYVPKFIAMAYVLNFTSHAKRPEFNQQTQFLVPTKIDSSLHLAKMCSYLAGDHKSDLLSLNCEFIKPVTGKSTSNTVLLPYEFSMGYSHEMDSLVSFAALSNSELRSVAVKSSHHGSYKGSTVHVVRSGETLSHISSKYGVSVKTIMRNNGLRNSRIRVGQRLQIRGYKHTKNHR
jgi:membrane-bound lytic murein transglycosylase D